MVGIPRFFGKQGNVNSRQLKLLALFLSVLALGACTSRAAMEAEQASVEQERVAVEQEKAAVAAQQTRQRAAREERERQAALAEQRRQEAEQARLAAMAKARAQAEAEAQVRIEQQQRQRQETQRRREAVARAQAERDEKLAQIEALEAQIAAMGTGVDTTETSNAIYTEAILVAEDLIDVLTAEQAKYENVDENGNTVEPLAKELISQLQDRKEALVQEAQAAAR